VTTVKKRIKICKAFRPFHKPSRYKVAEGGRGGGRSWSVALMLIVMGMEHPLRILCTREYQRSIQDSVHRTLKDMIEANGLDTFYTVERSHIYGANGTEFVFMGLRHNPSEIKSTEGIDICWVEEAHNVSAESWDYLIPTVRKEGSEIWVTLNAVDEDAATWQRFVVHPPPNSIHVHTTVYDNEFAPQVLLDAAEWDRQNNPDKYEWVWLGKPRRISEAAILAGKMRVADFDTPDDARFYHGVDFGFANDPLAVVRAFVLGNTLYVDADAGGVGVEIQQHPAVIDSVPTARKWRIYGDAARPEVIRYLQREGYNIAAAKKWKGSVEAGIEYLRSFDEIVVHSDCHCVAEEMRNYSYKVDRSTGEVLPIVVDAHNHWIDALRYALSERIRQGGKQVFVGRANETIRT